MAKMNYGLKPISTIKRSIGASSAQTAAIGVNVQYVRLVTDTACHYEVGVNPTATSSNVFLPANEIEIIKISEGEKIAVIGTSGNLYITSLVE